MTSKLNSPALVRREPNRIAELQAEFLANFDVDGEACERDAPGG